MKTAIVYASVHHGNTKKINVICYIKFEIFNILYIRDIF